MAYSFTCQAVKDPVYGIRWRCTNSITGYSWLAGSGYRYYENGKLATEVYTDQPPTPPPPTTEVDVFGTKKIYQDKVDGNSWDCRKVTTTTHEIKTDRDVKKEWQDPIDPVVWMPAVGDGHAIFNGDGTWIAKGKSPRITVLKSWESVESTVYAKPLKYPDNVDIRAKTDHYCVPNCSPNCFGGYIVTYHWLDGDTTRVTFKKEQTHDLGYTPRMGTKRIPPIPKDRFVGFKHVVYNLGNGHVKMEAYIDLTGGVNGGDWKKITEETDDATKEWGIGDNDKVYPPYTRSTIGSAIRCNSSDTQGYAEYMFKNWTIREITKTPI